MGVDYHSGLNSVVYAGGVHQRLSRQRVARHFTGEAISVNDNLLVFRSDDGAEREAMLGPPWFWSENSIALNPGDRIEFEGFDSPDHTEINWIANLTTGERLELRTAEGAPVWAQ
jgi:hypothetical protein